MVQKMAKTPLPHEVIMICKICDQRMATTYDGPVDQKTMFEWADARHLEISPGCPYRFRNIQYRIIASKGR